MRKALREKVSTDYALDYTEYSEIATRLGLGLYQAQRDSNKIRLEAYTERSEIATRLGWKPIPSAARVTRDEVSGL